MTERTVVHLLRHGEVHNPEGVLYGRIPDYHLSNLGQEMAQRIAEVTADRDITYVVSSPLERAQETATPTAQRQSLPIATDPDLIEAGNVLEGRKVGGSGGGLVTRPQLWRHLYNPWRPSWGEPYTEIAARMSDAVDRAWEQARGHEALVVSHQLPIWVARLDKENRKFPHNPKHRQCALASLTSLVYDGDRLSAIVYTEPCADLVELSNKGVGA